ncbi:homocysteine-responsive endoplasmic reticulum-resident ubiquitin-like domain member 1 protein isoform X1 [Anopheles stephensi]|uniref:homocysteine-responsive endoplasmic reticulum-resident ubiquitin-like domain member 1 protein isoform X1 n=2 Tax=Anopheles stephensi TaxID=30069 RepID=UPI00165873F4|nr:homocysteine-responsive endoplasmic reticulum-resident ubiquitin-like domain member 1 protein isoform X1 [Anopheles stephensi]
MDVTLIVKASNQQCEDLTIKCEPSWTIRRLKGHLTEVYPGKPSTDEQKLIYSGQLLSDSVVLKDVLRQYDGQQAHTVHLVFTPKNSYYGGSSSGSKSNASSKMVPNSSTSSAGPNATSNSNGSSGNQAASSSAPVGAPSYDRTALGDGLSTMEETSGDGVRHRSVSQGRSTAARANPARPSQFAEQTAAYQSFMQHTYMQYFNQYVNLINGQNNANALYAASGLPGAAGTAETAATSTNPLSGAQPFPAVPFVPLVQPTAMAGGFPNLAYYPCMTPAPYSSGFPSATNIPSAPSGAVNAGNVPASVLSSSSSSGQPIPSPQTSSSMADASTTPSAVPSASGTDTAAAAEQQAGAAAQDGAAQAGAGAAAPARARRFPNIVVEEQENNDWLDVFFSMCRIGILITVIYLYSSPMRCLTVLFIGVMLYLKKHLDRVYQAIDRRIPRLQPNQEANAAAAAPQPVAAVQPNTNVPDHNPAEQQRPPNVGASGVENVSKTTENAAGPSGSQETNDASTSSRTAMPRPSSSGRGNEPTTKNEAAADDQQQQQQQLLQRTEERTNTTEGETAATAEQPAAEGQRMTLNDMTSFLGTLVITFFTSIIPDTPAA